MSPGLRHVGRDSGKEFECPDNASWPQLWPK